MRSKAEPCSTGRTGHCQQGNTGKSPLSQLHHLSSALLAAPRLSLPASKPQGVFCCVHPPARSYIGFAISHIPSSGCTRGRVLELLASTLSALAGRGVVSTSHHDTCHRGFGQRGHLGIKSNTEAYICWSTRLLQRWADVQPECPRGKDIP